MKKNAAGDTKLATTNRAQRISAPKARLQKESILSDALFLEAPPGFEPGQSRICSPLPYHLAMAPDIRKEGFIENPLFFLWSGLRGSNSLPPPWQGGALPRGKWIWRWWEQLDSNQ